MFKKLSCIVGWLSILSWVSGCVAPGVEPTVVLPTATQVNTATPTALPASASPTVTLTASPEPTLTHTPSATPTDTATATATASHTPTRAPTRPPLPTLTPTWAGVVAGTYPQNSCASYGEAYSTYFNNRPTLIAGTVSWCVTSVVVGASGMEVFISWTVTEMSNGTSLEKQSDRYNRSMYLIDNLGLRYDHVDTTGAVRDGGRTSPYNNMPPLLGSFIFPLPQPGARSFTFHYDERQVIITFQLVP